MSASTPRAVSSRPETKRSPNMTAFIVLGIALTAASFAAVTIRLAQMNGLPSPLIAAGRLALASLLLTPIVIRRYRGQLRNLRRSDLLWTAASGFWLGTHFTLLVFALENTSVLVAQVLINTGPLWVALLERFFLNVRLPRMVYVALLITLGGGVLIALQGIGGGQGTSRLLDAGGLSPLVLDGNGGDPLLGALLAIGAAVGGSIYLTIGRKVRARVSLVPYVWLLYAAGGLTGFIIVALSGTPVLGHPPMGYFWLVVITLVPQLIGHSGFNFVLGYISATLVSISTQTVSVSAAVIAFFLFAEVPTLLEIVGSGITVVGVVIAILAGREKKMPREADTVQEAAQN